ncbi:DUF6612 family protein [Oceanobacillus damuensis]|uniref:DUF6612 family protein n=1 Tax=Oceanobacillus damuensis TaxID=937928 RepID=UPI00082E23A3|nr:DUF6612 family protein [Oceanobacillus damuensis]
MRKWMVFFVLLLTVILAACSNEDAEGVFTKAMDVSGEMESAEVDMNITQILSTSDESMELEMESDMKAEIIMDPIAMYQKGTMNMEMDGFPMEMDTEMYMTEDGLYTYDSMSQTWMKLDNEMYTDLSNLAQQDPSAQLEMMEPFMDDVEYEEKDDSYIFRFAGEGEALNEFSESVIQEYLDTEMFADLGADVNEVLESMTVNKLNYEMEIDKESYETKTFYMDLDMALSAEGEEMSIAQQVNAVYTGINTIDSIEVPQEVLDNATEMSY